MNLETSYAAAIVRMLQDAQDVGLPYAVFEMRPSDMELQPHQFALFDTLGAALDHWEARAGLGYLPGGEEYPVYYRHVDQLIEEINQVNNLTKQEVMNYNNLENMKEQMQVLRFSKKAIEETQQNMEKGLPDFTVHDKIKGNKGMVEVSAYFKQSGQSENYYLNKFSVSLHNGKELEEGQKYMVISPNLEQPGKNLVKSFDNVIAAIDFFKSQKGDSQLVAGKDAKSFTQLAKMEKGNINYVEKSFDRTFKYPATSHTFFVDRSKGFTVEQAANLIQGRAVFRDDLLNLNREPYAAWVKFDFDSPKDKYQNFTTNQYHVPSYGFVTKDALEKYNIKELNDPEKAEKIFKSIENGNRPFITATQNGEENKYFIEANPRYRQINFFEENGKSVKRELFLKEQGQDKSLNLNRSNVKQQEQGIGV